MSVRERHGVVLEKPAHGCFIDEREKCVRVRVVGGDYNSESNTFLSPDEARYIASKLRRVARRVEERVAEQASVA